MQDPLELLWLDPNACSRIRQKPEWRRILDQPHAHTAEPAVPDLPNQKASREDRSEVFEILATTRSSDGAAIHEAMAAASRSDTIRPPALLVVEGEIQLASDALERLRGLAANALPFSADDEALKRAATRAIEYTSLPGLRSTPLAIDTLTLGIREAFARNARAVPADFLDTETQRALLEHRRYEVRTFRGEPHLRCLLRLPSEPTPLLVFALAEVAAHLPLEPSFRARLIVEVHAFSDRYEPQTFALQTLALARRICLTRAADGERGDLEAAPLRR